MDRASYEAGFRAAQQAPQQDNSFLNALGVGALGAGAGIAYGRRRDIKKGFQNLLARRDARDKTVAQSRKERPTGVTITDLSDVDVDTVRTAAGYKPTSGAEESNFPVQTSYVEDQKVRGASDASIAGAGDTVNRGLANDQLGGASPEQVASSTEQVVPSSEQRSQVYEKVAAKPTSDLPPVSRPQGGIDPGTITDPNTGEIFSSGQSPSTAKSVDANQIANEQLAKKVDELSNQMRADKQEQKIDKAIEKFEKATDDLKSRDFLSRQLQDRGYVAPGTATPGSGFKQFSQEADQVSREAVEAIDTDAPKSSAPVASQATEAIDTGADQEAMRVSRTVQRDPGENLAEFEQVQDGLEQRGASPVQAADAAVAVTEGNVAFTQTDRPLSESSAARFLAAERNEIASQLGELGKPITPGRIEQELANRLGSDAYKYGPKYTQRKQNLQLGATYDPELFENMAKPTVRIAGEEVPTGRVAGVRTERTPYTNTLIEEDVELGLRQPTYMKETAERLQERAADQRDWLGSVRLEEASKNAKNSMIISQDPSNRNSIMLYRSWRYSSSSKSCLSSL